MKDMLFQFHKGTIRTEISLIMLSTITYFNSIKVQLEHLMQRKPKSLEIFQFHKGTIRTYSEFPYTSVKRISIP